MLHLALSLALLTVSNLAFAAECPSNIYYKSGANLKSGSTFYYPDGRYLRSGSTVYYPNANHLKSGSTLYYPDGRYFKSGSTLYYPNNNYIMSGSTIYYANGNYLRSGSSFYYPSNKQARSGSTLYREDGSRTEFPVVLEEKVGDFGRIVAYVQKDSERIELDLGTMVNTDLVTVGFDRATIDNTSDLPITVELRTGHPNEKVRLRITNGEVKCELAGAEIPGEPSDFTLVSKQAEVSVRVFDSRNSDKVKKALMDALLSLEQARPAR